MLHLAFHNPYLLKCGNRLVPYGQRGCSGEFLRQIPHPMTGGDDHRTRRRLDVAMDDLQQCRFPRTIMPHKSDTILVTRHKRNVLEEEVSSEID